GPPWSSRGRRFAYVFNSAVLKVTTRRADAKRSPRTEHLGGEPAAAARPGGPAGEQPRPRPLRTDPHRPPTPPLPPPDHPPRPPGPRPGGRTRLPPARRSAAAPRAGRPAAGRPARPGRAARAGAPGRRGKRPPRPLRCPG